MIFQISGTIRIFDNVPFYMKKIGTTISGESRKLNPPKASSVPNVQADYSLSDDAVVCIYCN